MRSQLPLLILAVAVAACHDGPTAPTTGSLAVAISGLPSGTPAQIAVSGPSGYTRTVTAADTLAGLKPGTYAFVAQRIHVPGAWYAGAADTVRATVLAGQYFTPVSVGYALATASLAIAVRDVPAGASPAITVTGPNGYQQRLFATDTLRELNPGTYAIAADSTTYQSNTWAPIITPSPSRTLVAAVAPDTVSVRYVPVTFTLTVNVAAPAGAPALVATLRGPNGFQRRLAPGANVVPGLWIGAYTVTADTLVVSGTSWDPQPALQSVDLSTANSVSVTWKARAAASGFYMTVNGAALTQVTQNDAGTVPIIANRAAMLRVFVTATQANTATPAVRVRLWLNGVVASTLTLTRPTGGVPTSIDDSNLGSTWNASIPASLVQPGLSIDAVVDPAGQVTQTTRAGNTWPASGQHALDIRSAVTPQLRLVPVTLAGATGNVNDGNKAQFLSTFTQVWPVNGYDADVRVPYVSNAPALQSNDGNSAWETVLSELDALRVADGSNRYYYGVVHVSYFSGIAGLGYVGAPTAMGWDYLPSGSGVLAHELGHNFGRLHSPCGGPSGVDPDYPYGNGGIGAPGWNASTNSLMSAAGEYDIMSYCHPQWVSDYTYSAVFNALSPAAISAAADVVSNGPAQDCLLVWGHISNGTPVLEPSFEVHTRPVLPRRAGTYAVRGVDASGAQVFSLSFAGHQIADLPGSPRTFAYAVPIAQANRARLAELRMTASGHVVRTVSAAGSATADPEVRMTRGASGRAALHWNAARFPMVMVRDAQTGELLSFARGGDAGALAARGDVDLIFSNQVRSVHRRVSPQ